MTGSRAAVHGYSMLELDDIQSGVLRPRPAPYAAAYVLFRIEDAKAGRELIRRIRPVVASAANPESPAGDTWLSVALSFQGLKALGVPDHLSRAFHRNFSRAWLLAREFWATPVKVAPTLGEATRFR